MPTPVKIITYAQSKLEIKIGQYRNWISSKKIVCEHPHEAIVLDGDFHVCSVCWRKWMVVW